MVVTLLTDFGLQDEYVGVVKGVILQVNPAAQMVDLCHQIPPGDIVRAGWFLAWSWSYFPLGTVHLVVVDPGVGFTRKILCLDHEGHRFLAPDNGVLSQLLTGVSRPSLYAVTNRRYALDQVSKTFHGRDIFAPAAGHLSKGLAPHRLGHRVSTFRRLSSPLLRKRSNILEGRVIHIDRFGNAVTNLPASEMKKLSQERDAQVRIKGTPIPVRSSYSAVVQGAPLSIVGSHDLLEVAVNQGSAQRTLGIQIGDSVTLVLRKKR